MNATRLLTILTLTAALTLTACAGGAQRQPEKSPEATEQKGDQKEGGAKKEKKQDPVKAGAKQMRNELDTLRTAVNAGDAATARKSSQTLDATWEKIEGEVRSRDAEQYEKIERPLHAVISGVGVSPLDRQTVGDQIDVLDEQLAQLNKSKKAGGEAARKVDIQIGAAAMRYHLGQITGALEKDTAAAVKSAKAADDAWEKFQGAVKQRDKETYTKIEDAMHNLMAAVQATPLDKKKAAEQLSKLDAALAGFLK